MSTSSLTVVKAGDIARSTESSAKKFKGIKEINDISSEISLGYYKNEKGDTVIKSTELKTDDYLELIQVKGLSSWSCVNLLGNGEEESVCIINIEPNSDSLLKKLGLKKYKFAVIRRLYVITVPIGQFDRSNELQLTFLNVHNLDKTNRVIGVSTHSLGEADATIFSMYHSISLDALQGMLKLKLKCRANYMKGKPFTSTMYAWEIHYENRPSLYTIERPISKTIPRIVSNLRKSEISAIDSFVLSGKNGKQISEHIQKQYKELKNKEKNRLLTEIPIDYDSEDEEVGKASTSEI